MGRVWSASLPVVTPVWAETPKPVTLILPFYSNHEFLQTQIRHWHGYSNEVRANFSAIIVDDGSPEPAKLPEHLPFPIRLFRIEQDVRWNWLAARNIGFHHAPDGWCLVTDMDHVVPQATAKACLYGQHNAGVIYGFSRMEHTGAELAPHPNSWFMQKRMFWAVGGYDEALSGFYGTDGDWRRRCAATAPMHILSNHLVRHEHVGDSSTQRYQRKQPEDAQVKKLIAQRGKGWQPKVLSFAYHEVVHAPSSV